MLIPKSVFDVSKAASDDPTRFVLNGVHVERTKDGPIAVATDGKQLIVATWDEMDRVQFPTGSGNTEPKEGFKALIPTKAWEEAKRNIKKTNLEILDNALLEEMEKDGRVNMVTSDLDTNRTVGARLIDGQFPQWRQVVPEYVTEGEKQDAHSIALTPALLASLVTALAGIAETEVVVLTIPHNPKLPVIITANGNGKKAKGVLMPVQMEGTK